MDTNSYTVENMKTKEVIQYLKDGCFVREIHEQVGDSHKFYRRVQLVKNTAIGFITLGSIHGLTLRSLHPLMQCVNKFKNGVEIPVNEIPNFEGTTTWFYSLKEVLHDKMPVGGTVIAGQCPP